MYVYKHVYVFFPWPHDLSRIPPISPQEVMKIVGEMSTDAREATVLVHQGGRQLLMIQAIRLVNYDGDNPDVS